MTIREAIEDAAGVLGRAGLGSPRLEAELLLEHVQGIPRLRLLLCSSETLGDESCARFRRLVELRSGRVPLQHLVGWAPFLEHRIGSTGDALVPRPETEQLALMAIERLRAVPPGMHRRVLDVGTGTACIPIAIAAAVPDAEVVAVEISPAAAALARRNLADAGLSARVRLVEGDAFVAMGTVETRFRLMTTNPPYIPSAEIAGLEPEVRDHDPRLALDGGEDGLGFYRRFAAAARGWLEPGGWMLAEFGDGQGPVLCDLFGQAGWDQIGVGKDLSGRERVLIVRSPPGPRS